MRVIPVRLTDEEVRKIDLLTKRGIYRSRSEAIRAILSKQLEEKLGEDEDVTPLVNKMLNLRKAGENPVLLRLKKSAVEVVAEGRH